MICRLASMVLIGSCALLNSAVVHAQDFDHEPVLSAINALRLLGYQDPLSWSAPLADEAARELAEWGAAGCNLGAVGATTGRVIRTDLPEPFIDNNGNGTFDGGDILEDLNRNGQWDNPLEGDWASSRVCAVSNGQTVDSVGAPLVLGAGMRCLNDSQLVAGITPTRPAFAVGSWSQDRQGYDLIDHLCFGNDADAVTGCNDYRSMMQTSTREVGCAVQQCSGVSYLGCRFRPGLAPGRPYEPSDAEANTSFSPLIDTFVDSANPNRNHGAEATLAVSNARNVVLVFPAAIAAAQDQVKEARLQLYTTLVDADVGADDAHLNVTRLGESAVDSLREGNGAMVLSEDKSTSTNQGSGSGITYNCPVDADISNDVADCSNEWQGGFTGDAGEHGMPATVPVGDIDLDVTSAVADRATAWAIELQHPSPTGVLFSAKENPNGPPPALVLVLERNYPLVEEPAPEEPAELAGMTAAHNSWRAVVGQPPVEWSADLARTAQAWADWSKSGVTTTTSDACTTFDHDPDLADGVGESIYERTANPTLPWIGSTWWGLEKRHYDAATGTCTTGECGHYAQMVQPAVKSIGCGVAECTFQYEFRGETRTSALQRKVVCRYEPREGPNSNYTGRDEPHQALLLALRDTVIRKAAPALNYGSAQSLTVSEGQHALVGFSAAAASVPPDTISRATLELTVASIDLPPDGSAEVQVRPLRQNWANTSYIFKFTGSESLDELWTEGGGDQSGKAAGGHGATWHCARDDDISDDKDTCLLVGEPPRAANLAPWDGATVGQKAVQPRTAPPVLHDDTTFGTVRFDVTEDVKAQQTEWLVSLVDDTKDHAVTYRSREFGVEGPRLILDLTATR